MATLTTFTSKLDMIRTDKTKRALGLVSIERCSPGCSTGTIDPQILRKEQMAPVFRCRALDFWKH
jgi:hypothetical protein